MSSGTYPVFPLKTICFPGHKIPLRIFEERYLKMLSEREDDPRFVISLISHGEEAGGNATPYRVGTLVEFGSVQKQGDFHMIRPLGLKRVYLESFDRESRPYLTAVCGEYGDEPEDRKGSLKLEELEGKILDMAQALGTEERAGFSDILEVVKDGLDRENFSLFLCGCLDLPPIYLQRLLESRSMNYRLENALNLLAGNS